QASMGVRYPTPGGWAKIWVMTSRSRGGAGGGVLPLLLALDVVEVGGVVRSPPEEAADHRALVGAAALGEHLVAPRGGRHGVEQPLLLEARQRVARERERPLVAVVARVVADEVAEARLEVRALDVDERVVRVVHL